MAEQLIYSAEAAEGYDRTFGCCVTVPFIPALHNFARLTPGMRILDICTGTGLVADAALKVVGPTGHVMAADISPAMLNKARERLGQHANCSFAVEDGQSLPLPDGSLYQSALGSASRAWRYRRAASDRVSHQTCSRICPVFKLTGIAA
jgi:SAM-dependent methyltransferase